jgi:hypothetical protein
MILEINVFSPNKRNVAKLTHHNLRKRSNCQLIAEQTNEVQNHHKNIKQYGEE